MSELEKKSRYDYSKYDEMSTDALEEILRLDFQMSEEADSDIDAILYISEVIARREKDSPDIETAWEQFNTKYRPYATDGRSLYDLDDEDSTAEPARSSAADDGSYSPYAVPQRRRWSGTRRLVRIAVIAALMAAFLFATSATAYALGFDIWGAFAQWTKETFSFVSPANSDEHVDFDTVSSPIEQEYASLQEALDAYGITEPLLPTWIPEGFVEKTVAVYEDVKPGCVVFYTCYDYEEKWLSIQINMYRNFDGVTYTTWQKDAEDIAAIDINGCVIYVVENAGRWSATWADDLFECNITGDVSLNELTEIIKSICRKDE